MNLQQVTVHINAISYIYKKVGRSDWKSKDYLRPEFL